MKFINRKRELGKLNELWEQKVPQLVVIHGKRRVGKTELIKQFIKDGKGIYYLADKRTHKEQLIEFARVVGNYFEDSFVSQKGFSDWLEAFDYLKVKAKKQKFVVAIDEYPYLVETDSATSSLFQKIWDQSLKETNIYLILCGSSMSMMESELLSYKAPLYGRLTGRLLIEPMDFEASRKFFPGKNFKEFLSYYCITGGMPAYMQRFGQYKRVLEAITNLCWDKQGLYHNEVNIALKQELRTPNNYFAILKAISWGKTRVSEIATNTGLKASLVNKYLDVLERLQFVKREVPVTESKPQKSKKGMYILTENFVRFWFQYVYAFSSDLEIRDIKQVKIKYKEFSNILEAIVYEQIAREHLLRLQDSIFPMDKVGRYWDNNTEIDGVGLNKETKQIVFMEAKWSNSKQNLRELKKLQVKAKNVDWNIKQRKDFFIIYSKSGFTKDLLDYSRANRNVFLVKEIDLVK
jgi:uncharacterized protein